MAAQFDVAACRSKFPSLDQGQTFLDNAGGSQALGSAIDAIRDYLTNTNVQLGASYPTGRAATERYGLGVAAGAKYINAADDEVVFGPSTTQLFRNLSFALQFDAGDDIILSTLDHEANISPWVGLARRQNLNIIWWKPNEAGSTDPRLLPSDLRALMTPRTRLVTCTHASNILGTITDVRAIADVVHDRSLAPAAAPLLCVDAVAYAPHRPVDVAALGVDFYCFSWYKVYGPHIAMMYGRRSAHAQLLSPLGHYFKTEGRDPATGVITLEDRLGLGGASYELLHAIPAVVEYLATSSSDGMVAHEGRLQARLLSYLVDEKKAIVYGSPGSGTEERVPTVSFKIPSWRGSSRELVEAVEKSRPDLGFRWGSFYSNRLVGNVLGLDPVDGIVRVSMVHYNTMEELESFIQALDEVISPK